MTHRAVDRSEVEGMLREAAPGPGRAHRGDDDLVRAVAREGLHELSDREHERIR